MRKLILFNFFNYFIKQNKSLQLQSDKSALMFDKGLFMYAQPYRRPPPSPKGNRMYLQIIYAKDAFDMHPEKPPYQNT